MDRPDCVLEVAALEARIVELEVVIAAYIIKYGMTEQARKVMMSETKPVTKLKCEAVSRRRVSDIVSLSGSPKAG